MDIANQIHHTTLEAGLSRSLQQNRILQRITNLFTAHDIWLSLLYIPSKENPADPPSRGIPLPFADHLPSSFILPNEVTSCIQPIF